MNLLPRYAESLVSKVEIIEGKDFNDKRFKTKPGKESASKQYASLFSTHDLNSLMDLLGKAGVFRW